MAIPEADEEKIRFREAGTESDRGTDLTITSTGSTPPSDSAFTGTCQEPPPAPYPASQVTKGTQIRGALTTNTITQRIKI